GDYDPMLGVRLLGGGFKQFGVLAADFEQGIDPGDQRVTSRLGGCSRKVRSIRLTRIEKPVKFGLRPACNPGPLGVIRVDRVTVPGPSQRVDLQIGWWIPNDAIGCREV